MPSTPPFTGFTLVELLVVIAIIGILVALLPQQYKPPAKRPVVELSEQYEESRVACLTYESQRGGLPPTTDARPRTRSLST